MQRLKMGFESRFYDIAERAVKETRARNKNIHDMRCRETEEKFPDIRDIQKALQGTSSKLLMLIADRGSDIKPKLEAAERENLSLQQKLKEALVRHGYPANYLDPVYTCGICKDTGIADGRRCRCFMDEVKKAASEELNSTSPLKLCGFEEFDLTYYDDKEITPAGVTAREVMRVNLEMLRKYAEDFHIPYQSILMRGRTGLGKTHLSLSIASEVLKKGYSVIYGSAPDLFRRIEKEHFGNSADKTDTLEMLIKTDLLVLDDLGAEFESKFFVSVFYNILNDRLNSSLPTIINTNLELAEIEKRYGERISSRIGTMKKPLFYGSDIRVLKERRKQ